MGRTGPPAWEGSPPSTPRAATGSALCVLVLLPGCLDWLSSRPATALGAAVPGTTVHSWLSPLGLLGAETSACFFWDPSPFECLLTPSVPSPLWLLGLYQVQGVLETLQMRLRYPHPNPK